MQGKMCPENYKERIVDSKIEQYLKLFGAVEISGTMWCGKTWSALSHSDSVIYVDRDSNIKLIQADPGYSLIGEKPHLIDEWQLVPQIWDTVRHQVDMSGVEKGQWLLTGSCAPDKSSVNHSGAGRIGRVHMRTMSLQESGDSSAKVSLEKLFKGEFEPCDAPSGITDIARLICRGGWPEVAESSSSDSQIILSSYLENVFNVSVARLGGKPDIARRLAVSIARNLCQSVNLSVYAKDVYAADSSPEDSQKRTISDHLELMASLYLTEEIPGWVPASRSPLRMRTKPKRYFTDQSVAVSLLGLSEESLLTDFQTFGLLFENMCMRDLAVYSSVLTGVSSKPLYYYRDDSDLEIDAVIEKDDKSYALIEIKLSPEKTDTAAENIKRVLKKITSNPKAKIQNPAFCAIITGTGDKAYKRPDGIYVIPIRTLGK